MKYIVIIGMCLLLFTSVFAATTNVSVLHAQRDSGLVGPLRMTDANVLRVNINLFNVTTGNLTVNEYICLGGICINTWDSVNQTGGGGGSSVWNRTTGFTFLINTNDNVGIGNNTPTEAIHIQRITGDVLSRYSIIGSTQTNTSFLDGDNFTVNTSIGTQTWSNPSNVQTSDDARSVSALSFGASVSNYLVSKDFNAGIPDGSNIDGIEVSVERSKSGPSLFCSDNAIRIIKGGVIGSTDKSLVGNWPTTDAIVVYGNSSDLWGETWTVDDINSNQFGFAISAAGSDLFNTVNARIDHISIKIYYTPGKSEWVFGVDSSEDSFKVVDNSELGINEFFTVRGGTGRVGIGTTNPNQLLQVVGNVSANFFIGDGRLLSNIPKTIGNQPYLFNDSISITLNETRLNITIDARSGGSDGTGGWTNTSNQTTTLLNVGIGTTTPSGLLHIQTDDTSSDWFNTSWEKRIKLTVQSDKVSENVSNFPVYIDISDLTVSFTSFNSDGGDLRITKSDGLTQVSVQVVSFNTSAETGEVHFRGNLSASTGTEFYLYYNNPTATMPSISSQFGSQSVWSEYGYVLHFQNSSYQDSTVNDNTVTPIGGIADSAFEVGQVGTALRFDGILDALQVADDDSLSPNSLNYTTTLWLNPDDFGSAYNVVDQSDTVDRTLPVLIDVTVGTVKWLFDDGPVSITAASAGGFTAGSWNHYAVTLNRTENGRMYQDGSLIGTDSISTLTGDINPASVMWIAERDSDHGGGGRHFDGLLDELRITNELRTQGWITTEFNALNDTSTFYSLSAEESLSTGLDALFVDLVGDVGINTTSPLFTLDVIGSINANKTLCIAKDCISSWASVNQSGGGGSGKQGDPPYLFNNTITMFFNETKLNETIDARSGGGNATSITLPLPNIIDIYSAAAPATFTTTPLEIIWDTQRLKDSLYNFTASSTDIQVLLTGEYWIGFDCSTSIALGTSRSASRCYLEVNDVEVPGSRCTMYNRINTNGHNSCSVELTQNLTALDILDVEMVRFLGTDTIVGVTDTMRFRMEYINRTSLTINSGSGSTGGNSSAWNRSGTDVILANTGDKIGFGTVSPAVPYHFNGTSMITIWENAFVSNINERKWGMQVRSDGTFELSIVSSGNSFNDWLRVQRTNFTVNSVNFDEGDFSIDMSGFFYNTTLNRVGIGNTAPTTALHVTGTINASVDVCLEDGTCLSNVNGSGGSSAFVSPVTTGLTTIIGFEGTLDGKVLFTTGSLAATSTTNLGAVWHLPEGTGTTSADSSGNGNTATFDAVTPPVWTEEGRYGTAVNFVGASSGVHMDVAQSDDINPRNGDFTVSGWIRTNNTGLEQTIQNVGRFLDSTGWTILIDTNDNLNFEVSDGTDEFEHTNTDVTILPNKWYYISAAWDATLENIEVAVNGTYTNGTNSPLDIGDVNGNTMWYGSRFGGAASFNGTTDDMSTWNVDLEQNDLELIRPFRWQDEIYFDAGKLDYSYPTLTGMRLSYDAGASKESILNQVEGTISMWVYTSWDANDSISHIFFDGESSSDTNRITLRKTAANNLSFAIYDNTGVEKEVSLSVDPTNFPKNTWHHIGGVYNEGSILLYLSGLSVGSLSGSGSGKFRVTPATLYIGRDASSQIAEAQSLISQVLIYNRALTDAEFAHNAMVTEVLV